MIGNVRHSLYRRPYAAGPVVLGGNVYDPDRVDHYSMYTIILRPDSESEKSAEAASTDQGQEPTAPDPSATNEETVPDPQAEPSPRQQEPGLESDPTAA